jgi:molybdenum cofactor guanylyltransferase
MIRVGGIVLCGGRSSRMGKPKAWLPFGGELMLQRVVRIVSDVLSPLSVVAAPDQHLPPLPREIVLARDRIRERGPLQAIAAGIDALHDRCDAVYVSSCDAPFLQPAFIRRLIELIGGHCMCVPKVGSQYHPLAAVYRTSVRDSAQRLLDANRLRLMDLFDLLPTRIVDASDLVDVDPTLQSLRNLNTPEEYERALLDVASSRDRLT